MVSFSSFDILIIILFFVSVVTIGFVASRKKTDSADDYLLSGRKVGLFLFVLTNVATWYGGIIGVGEFTYRYGLVSWFTQGFPYYIFALLFAIFFAKKIRETSLFTIPDKLTEVYGKKAGLAGAVIVFLLVSPAPYFLMSAYLISLIFEINLLISLMIAFLVSGVYLIYGGFRANIFSDAFQFFVMFIGFIILFVVSLNVYGGTEYLQNNLPASHLKLTGDVSPTFVIVWFLIALWTFADPGFHQRCYSAKTSSVAKKGIIISIFFWALFDFLTTSTGLFSRAVLPELSEPILAFPILAEQTLSSGLKGIFYAALFATILSTSNSFLFLSATTIGRDFIYRGVVLRNKTKSDYRTSTADSNLKNYTIIGIFITGTISIIIAYLIPSVVELWYSLGSILIPGIILPIVSAYYPKLQVAGKVVFIEMLLAVFSSSVWLMLRENYFQNSKLYIIEPMLIGLIFSVLVHFTGLVFRSFNK